MACISCVMLRLWRLNWWCVCCCICYWFPVLRFRARINRDILALCCFLAIDCLNSTHTIIYTKTKTISHAQHLSNVCVLFFNLHYNNQRFLFLWLIIIICENSDKNMHRSNSIRTHIQCLALLYALNVISLQ